MPSHTSLRPLRIPLLAVTAGLALTGLGVLGAGPASAAAPGNDNVAGATTLTDNTPVLGTYDDATVETGEDRCDGDQAVGTVWYRYTAAATQTVSFEVGSVGDNVDTDLTAYTGPAAAAAFGNLTYVDCNDDSFELLSQVTLDVTAGTTYYLQMDALGTGDPKGGWTLTAHTPVAATPQANDNLAAAARLIPFVAQRPDTRLATIESTEPEQVGSGCAADVYNTVWYHYTPAIDREDSFYTTGDDASVVNVYSGPANATAAQLTPEGCDTGGGAGVELNLVAGTEYYVQLGTPAPGGAAPATFGLEQETWNQPAKLTGTGAASGQTVTLGATVAADPYANDTPAPTAPAGTVEVLENGTTLGTAAVAGNAAALTIANATPGVHRYLMSFVTDNVFYKDAFRYVTVTVPPKPAAPAPASSAKVKAPQKVTLQGHRNAAGKVVVKAKKVKIKATITAGGAPATGQVVFKAGKKTYKGTLKNGVATVKIPVTRTTKVTYTYAGSATAQPVTGKLKIKVKVVVKP